ncbi:MAG: S41 family peptidase, partial [Bacteroidota bacterium]
YYRDPSSLPLLNSDALLADFALIETIFREVHPGTYRYLSEEELTTHLAELEDAFSSALSVSEAYLALNKFIATIKCGHTASPLYNQNADVTAMLFFGPDKLPFTFQWVEGQMIILLDATDESVFPAGTEIKAINGHKAYDILEAMRQYVPTDGPAVSPKDGLLSLQGYSWRYELFDAVFHLLFPPTELGYEMEYLQAGETESKITTVRPLLRRERSEILAQRYPDHPRRSDDLWSLDLSLDEIGVLTVGDFTAFGKGALELDYELFFADVFNQINRAGIEKLIIDVRDNQGGNDPIVSEMLTYLQHRPQRDIQFEGRMRYQSFPEELRPYVKTWGDNIPAFFDPEQGKPDESGRYYIYPKSFKPERGFRLKRQAFNGEVVFLTSRVNASLGFYLANYVRQNQVGTIIGETTGGCQRGINGGNLALLRLPNTNLELDFPVLGGFALGEVPALGVVPDIEVIFTADDIAAGRDVVMEAAVDYLMRE